MKIEFVLFVDCFWFVFKVEVMGVMVLCGLMSDFDLLNLVFFGLVSWVGEN